MTLSVTILGCSGMYATPERAASGYLLELADKRIWLDAGGGTWRNLLQHVDYKDLDGVVLTHLHPDHTIDVFQAFHARNYGNEEPLPRIPLWAPQETLDRLLGFATEMDESFELRAVSSGESVDIDGATFSFFRMAHPPETLGVRLTSNGTVVAYSADTGPDADFEALAGGADLFLCEATIQEADRGWSGHLTAAQAGEIARRCDVSRLILTHLPPGRDLGLTLTEAERTCGSVETRLAADGLRLQVGE